MSTPNLDPSLPADNSPLSSGELSGQFQAIQNSFDDIRARRIALTPLGLTVSNPPTQADVQALAHDPLRPGQEACLGRRGVSSFTRFMPTRAVIDTNVFLIMPNLEPARPFRRPRFATFYPHGTCAPHPPRHRTVASP